MGEVKDLLKNYFTAYKKLTKLELKEEFSGITSKLILISIAVLFASIVLFLLSFGAAIYLGVLLKSEYMGFFIVSGAHILLLSLGVFFGRKLNIADSIQKYILDNIS